MKRPAPIFAILLAVLPLPAAPGLSAQTAPVTAIVGATVIDGTGAEPTTATVLIKGDRIEAVAPLLAPPPGARVIDGRGLTLLPGLFDLHTHLPYATAAGVAGDWPKNLKAYLYCGITSVVDFGTYGETFEPMRRLIKNGVVAAPRISYAYRITTPGGHGAEGGRGDIFSIEVSTAREARAAIRRVLPYQPDVIKVFTDGWRYGNAPEMTSMNEETLAALVEEAHRHGLEVLTHTVTLAKAKIAARAGVDVLAHGIGDALVDAELLQLLRTRGTTYVSTLAVYEPRERNILSPLLAAVLEPAVRAAIQPTPVEPPANGPGAEPPPRWHNLLTNVALLHKGGATFGVGTDAGVTGTHHGWATLRELKLLVTGGLTPLEALTAATGNSAKALKVAHERGTITAGKLADLLLVEGEPHKRIADIERIKHVFVGGREIDREKLTREIAAPTLSVIPALKAGEKIDDFERADGRSTIDTRWLNATDSGHDHSRMTFGRILRANQPSNGARDHALSLAGTMADKERPFIRVGVPLSHGAVEPVDARAFRGVRFDVRGEGAYQLLITTYGARGFDYPQASFHADAQWRTISIDFSVLKPARLKGAEPWTPADLLTLNFEIARAAGAFGWLELDNIGFYK